MVEHAQHRAIPANLPLAHRPCWCGEKRAETLYDTDRWGQKLRSVVCGRCGTLRLDPRLTAEQARVYYEREYSEELPPAEFHEMQRAQRSETFVQRFLPPNSRILDYGCGPGGKLAALVDVDEGYRIDGHDLNAEYLEFAVSRGLGRFHPEVRYDVVYLSHTIEHWVDVREDLSSLLAANVADGGLAIIQVPLLDRLLLGPRRDGVRGEIMFPHIWYFSVATLDDLMRQMKFRRVYTDRLDLCVYRHVPSLAEARVHDGRLASRVLRGAITLCSVPRIGWVFRRANYFLRYIDVYHRPPIG